MLKNLKTNPYRIQIHLILISMCLYVQLFLIMDRSPDYDLLWHIKQGQVYLTHGVTTQDYLSWQNGLTWTTAEWLYEVIMYLLTKYTGTIGFVLLLTFSTYSIYGWTASKNNLKHPIIFMAIFAATIFFPRNTYNRPGELQIVMTMWFLWQVLNNDKYLVYKSIAFGIILANFHGGQMITALAIMAIQIVCVGIHSLIGEEQEKTGDKQLAKKLVIQLVQAFIQSLLNPMGIEMYKVGLEVPQMYSTKFITEWATWNIEYTSGILILLSIIQVAHQKDFKRYSLKSIQILAITQAFTIMQIKTQRVAGYLQAIIVLFCYEYIIELYEDILSKLKQLRIKMIQRKIVRVAEYIEADEQDKNVWESYKTGLESKIQKLSLEKEERSAFTKQSLAVYAVIIAGIIIFDCTYMITQIGSTRDFKSLIQNNTDYQMKTVEYLKDNNIESGVLNQYSEGGWLIWNDIKQFVDSRQQPFTEEIQGSNNQLNELLEAVNGPQAQKDIQSLCDKYNIDYIVWNTVDTGYDIQNDMVNSGKWEIVIKDMCKNQETEYVLKRIK